MGVRLREIKYNSEDYKKELALRDEVLRKPLGLSLYDEDLTEDKHDFHLGVFVGSTIVGVLVLTRISADKLKMRQVAVAEKWRGKTVGRQMVRCAEQCAIREGCKMIVLNARKTAVMFYEKLGYEKISEMFLEISIPHYKMCKYLPDSIRSKISYSNRNSVWGQ
jgi:predicted GNAT family N-acyltransferase